MKLFPKEKLRQVYKHIFEIAFISALRMRLKKTIGIKPRNVSERNNRLQVKERFFVR